MMRSRKRPAWIIRWASSSGVGSTSPRHDPTSFIACFRTHRTSPHDWIGLYGFAAGTIIGDGCTKTYERRVTRYQRCAKPSLPAGDLPRGDLASDLRRVTLSRTRYRCSGCSRMTISDAASALRSTSEQRRSHRSARSWKAGARILRRHRLGGDEISYWPLRSICRSGFTAASATTASPLRLKESRLETKCLSRN